MPRGVYDRSLNRTRPVAERLWAKVNKNGSIPVHRPDLGPCWLWMAYISPKGYGRIGVGTLANPKMRSAHVVAYEVSVGPVPEGLDLDHLCRVRHCVNPKHLEPVTRRVNLMRGDTLYARNARKTHCPNGHEYTPDNTGLRDRGRGNVSRFCKACIPLSIVKSVDVRRQRNLAKKRMTLQ